MPASPDESSTSSGSALAGELLALLATVVWAGGFLLARGLRDAVPPVALNFWRWAIATAVVAPFTLTSVRRSWPAIRRSWLPITAAALLGVDREGDACRGRG